MRLEMHGDIYFRDIGRRVPVGIPCGVSREFLFFAKDACNAARRDILFAEMLDNPDHGKVSLLTGADAICYPSEKASFVLIFVRQESCDEIVALHELMHVYLSFAEGYRSPRSFAGSLPSHVRLFAELTGNIAMDLHTNQRLQRRGFPLDSLRERYFAALSEYLPLMANTRYSDDVGFQWQIGAMWGHMLAGRGFYRPNESDHRVHRRLEETCQRFSPGTIRFRDLLINTCEREGYDTPEKVGRIVDEITPKLFEALGEEYRPDHLLRTSPRSQAVPFVRPFTRCNGA